MRFIVADSGSTKTTWLCSWADTMMVTEGLNPRFTSDEAFLAALGKVRTAFGEGDTLFFYGAGCGSEAQATRWERLAMQSRVAQACRVYTDLLGACRALWGQETGYVGILGTGSNACYYDGQRIASHVISTGYILGDHGSGNHIGRLLLQDYLTHAMPQTIWNQFCKEYPFSAEEFLNRVYNQPQANRFLASLAQFAVEHLNEAYVSHIVSGAVEKWIENQLLPLHVDAGVERRVGIVGGLASAIEGIVQKRLKEHGFSLFCVMKDPAVGLKEYHLN